ncbi:RNA-directed DNA polymerase, eukaryota [Tanacetum coccineum]
MLIGYSTLSMLTNFRDNVIGARSYFKRARKYGHVVDSYIPVKKSKYGKRFGFVKFINVFSEERLVNNLCTVWIGRVRLHANIARFQRPNGVVNGDTKTMLVGFKGYKRDSRLMRICVGSKWKGVPFKFVQNNTFTRIDEKWKIARCGSENIIVDRIFSKKEKEVSEDPFNLYSLLKRQNKLDDKDTNSEDSLKHPPGFTPLTHNCENDTSEKEGGSMVGLLEDVIKVGQVMGFKMEGVIANLEELIGTQGGKEGGLWLMVIGFENPNDVKKEFFDHFANRFGKPDKPTASISLDFPNQISHEQSDLWRGRTLLASVDRDVCEAVR